MKSTVGAICVTCFIIFGNTSSLAESDITQKPSNALIVTDVPTSSDDETTVTIEEDHPNDVFQPSKNWKPIKPGQAIPKGLHVRVNLATGEKEARLLQDEEGEQGRPSEGTENEQLSPQKLKEALKKIKSDDIPSSQPRVSKSKFRSLEELKKEFKDSYINVKSETEILIDLLERYKSCKQEDDKINILQDLEYVSHHYDVAQDLVRHDGLQLLLPDLNSSVATVRSLVCETLGAAMQGNPRVQIAVLEHNGLTILIRMVVLDPSLSVRTRALFAMSCLLRNFPFAQQRMIENGGMQLMASVLQNELLSSDLTSLKIKLKVVTLFNDLLVEQDFAQNLSTKEGKDSSNYYKFSFRKLLVEHGFCDLIGDLLLVPDVDIPERVIPAMKSLSPDCSFEKQLPSLHSLEKKFGKQRETEEYDEDRNQLLENIRVLIKRARKKDEL